MGGTQGAGGESHKSIKSPGPPTYQYPFSMAPKSPNLKPKTRSAVEVEEGDKGIKRVVSLEYIRHPGLRPRRISVLTRSGTATAFFDRNIRLLVDGQKANCTAWLLASLLLLFLHGVLLISWLRDALARRAGHGRHV